MLDCRSRPASRRIPNRSDHSISFEFVGRQSERRSSHGGRTRRIRPLPFGVSLRDSSAIESSRLPQSTRDRIMDDSLHEFVRLRRKNRCEYCFLPQSAARFFAFQIENIRAKQHGGHDLENNLALACPDCNAHKLGGFLRYFRSRHGSRWMCLRVGRLGHDVVRRCVIAIGTFGSPCQIPKHAIENDLMEGVDPVPIQ